MSLPLEAELVLRGVRRAFGPADDPERLGGLVRQNPDWPRTVELARRNRVIPLLYRGLTDCPGVPEAVFHDLGARAEWSREKNLALARELHRILALFREHDIRVLSFKGPELACEAYGEIGLRPFGDLDLLIHPRDAARVEAVLPPEGYRLQATCTWQHFFRNDAGVGLDIHWALGARWMRSPAEFEEWWDGARRVPVGGSPVPTLPVEDLVLVICLLLTKDCMSREQRLVQLCDLVALLSRHRSLDQAGLLERARRLDMHRMVLLQYALASDLLGARLPERFAAAANGEPVVARLAREARSGFLRETRDGGAGESGRAGPGIAGHRFFLRTQARHAHRLRYLLVMVPELVRMAVTPTERDREFLPMARSWKPVQYLVRPVRVLRRWARTGRLILD